MFRSYQVVLLIDGLLSYSHFVIHEKTFLIISSHVLYCQVVSYLFLLLLVDLSGSNWETETTK